MLAARCNPRTPQPLRHLVLIIGGHQLCPCDFHDLDLLERRFPRLIFAMKQAAILSTGEATCAIRDFKHGWPSGEAVDHFGGPARVIQAALRWRTFARKIRAGRYD